MSDKNSYRANKTKVLQAIWQTAGLVYFLFILFAIYLAGNPSYQTWKIKHKIERQLLEAEAQRDIDLMEAENQAKIKLIKIQNGK